ncbi:N-acetyltransferase [Bacillus sp. MMSF_3328]|uniref:GNAT family N-acetyltransferase n=1 Tax=Bacillus sp. MMSF_3328 TaxID=3047080 RepID=UPI00273D3265|nr:GNAT family N-acetyltransferase [Bacillus sp. MMSF_3328]
MGAVREIIHLNIKDFETAKAVLSIQIPAYKIEAEIIGFDAIPQLFDTAESLMASRESFVGMCLDGRLAGVLAYEEDENWVVISRLTVHPSFFRRGIAKSLLAHLTSEFTGRKWRVLTGKGNMPALQLYISFGFKEKGELEPEPGVQLTVLEKE